MKFLIAALSLSACVCLSMAKPGIGGRYGAPAVSNGGYAAQLQPAVAVNYAVPVYNIPAPLYNSGYGAAGPAYGQTAPLSVGVPSYGGAAPYGQASPIAVNVPIYGAAAPVYGQVAPAPARSSSAAVAASAVKGKAASYAPSAVY